MDVPGPPDLAGAEVTLAPSGGEGGNSMGAMRWAQTANYGVAPNPAMPKTWLGGRPSWDGLLLRLRVFPTVDVWARVEDLDSGPCLGMDWT